MLKLQIVGLISMLSAVAALALALNTRRSNNLALRRHFDLIAPPTPPARLVAKNRICSLTPM